ncbi:Psy3p KNAG_0B05950 [Huiozyma naganishii CBS 8797]|uniref:DNA recombination and repair protein Rad51-like C-terminal domain-containing protein n=1 Tax=Huiozyma naganishii (strain ATCC MYA-139 / BCRC 22969 / CBS 8797 / KCTC 17520 / NBRC 10181 / NCYC 3082 / Yp74L-3) TaxID=1071383 RepID=J7R2J2_HUIN7|nr:hypothetical protein KNAG_0B05950 [Kazachstania naganishii CBS 8797]CCK69025.1 hypothetical protein KNAG_0B05950 [Kazachstania naganishii CBS 8797]
MDIIARCKVYPLGKYITPAQRSLDLPPAGHTITNGKPHSTHSRVHIIVKDIRHGQIIQDILTQSAGHGCVLVVDNYGNNHPPSAKDTHTVRHLVSSTRVEDLTAYLRDVPSQLPTEARTMPLQGIIVDNLSLCRRSRGPGADAQLLETLRKLQRRYGCWVVTVSYGIGFATAGGQQLAQTAYPTSLPLQYLNECDTVLYTETRSQCRQLK